MGYAMLPIVAAIALAFLVHGWVSDELDRDGRLSAGGAAAVTAVFVIQTMLVTMAAAGGALRVDVPVPLAIVIGAPLAAGGAALAGWAWRALGSRERMLAIRTDAVVTSGPYRFARHPFYLGWTLALLGAALAGRSGLAVGLVLLMIPPLVRIARREERWLSERLGADYISYHRATPGLIGRR